MMSSIRLSPTYDPLYARVKYAAMNARLRAELVQWTRFYLESHGLLSVMAEWIAADAEWWWLEHHGAVGLELRYFLYEHAPSALSIVALADCWEMLVEDALAIHD